LDGVFVVGNLEEGRTVAQHRLRSVLSQKAFDLMAVSPASLAATQAYWKKQL
jgi:hypothetical protein